MEKINSHNEKSAEQDRLLKSGTRKATGTLVECKRCHKAYKPNNYEICDACVSELEYQSQYDEEIWEEAREAELRYEMERDSQFD